MLGMLTLVGLGVVLGALVTLALWQRDRQGLVSAIATLQAEVATMAAQIAAIRKLRRK